MKVIPLEGLCGHFHSRLDINVNLNNSSARITILNSLLNNFLKKLNALLNTITMSASSEKVRSWLKLLCFNIDKVRKYLHFVC